MLGLEATRSAKSRQHRSDLKQQAAQFPEKVVKIADGVYTAVGYSVSNVSMIVGEDGVIIVDTGMDVARGELIAQQFRKITEKPVKAIIFTHSHGDHTGGAAAFFGSERPQIWARANFGSEAKPLEDGGTDFSECAWGKAGRLQIAARTTNQQRHCSGSGIPSEPAACSPRRKTPLPITHSRVKESRLRLQA